MILLKGHNKKIKMDNGWIKLHRKLLEWEWYDDTNTFRLFIHILLSANHEDKKYRGKLIPLGSFLTSLDILAAQTGLSIRSVRTSLTRLKTTNEISIKSTRKGSHIFVCKYSDYQSRDLKTPAKKLTETTNSRQTADKQTTSNKNDKNDKNIYIISDVDKIQFDSFKAHCEKWNIENLIKIKDYFILKSEFDSKVNWWEQVKKCITWLVSNQKKKINLQRLQNWMSNSVKFQKDYETKMKQQYQDKTNQLAPKPAQPKKTPLWKPPA